MDKRREPYHGIIQNAKVKDIFCTTLLCFLMNIGYDGVDSAKINALERIFTIGRKRNYPVKQHLATCMEILSTRDAKFLSNINAALHPNVKEEDPVEVHIKNS